MLISGQPLHAAMGSSFLGKCFASIDANQCDAVAKCSCLFRSLQAKLHAQHTKSHAHGFCACVQNRPHSSRQAPPERQRPQRGIHNDTETPHQLTRSSRVRWEQGKTSKLLHTRPGQSTQASTKPARSVGQQKQRRAEPWRLQPKRQPGARQCPSGSPARSSNLP